MKCYSLSNSAFSTLLKVNLEEMGKHLLLNRENNSVQTDRLGLLLTILNEEISLDGMTEDQQRVNEYGKQLYTLFDELYAQK